MSDKKCPHCGLWSIDSALRCDCGYDFEKGTVEESYVKGEAPEDINVRMGVGKIIVIAIYISTLSTYLLILTVVGLFSGFSTSQLIIFITRVALTSLLFYFVYRKKIWAKWLAGILLAVVGFPVLLSGIAYIQGTNNWLAGYLMLFAGAVYSMSACLLFFSSSVKYFLNYPSTFVDSISRK